MHVKVVVQEAELDGRERKRSKRKLLSFTDLRIALLAVQILGHVFSCISVFCSIYLVCDMGM